ncbi:MAG: sulfite exporter TauE/SafE family protein [Candidatus Sabulitectum sp.]|nr:sulfite exporter TauE/SafE family protein [Candidatus Sabulitectum sp.]
MLLGAGILAGFINVTAGGGSLLTLPVLILAGMPPVVANGTNRIAVLIQNIFASGNFHRHGRRDIKQGILLGLAAVPGAVAGALVAVDISDAAFKWILSGAILLGLSVILFHRRSKSEGSILKRKPLQMVLFLIIGFYGGLIQAGTGYLIIFSLTIVGGLGLAKTNSMKAVIIAVYLIPSIMIFAKNGNIQIIPGLVLASGNSIGGILGSNFSQKMNPKWIKAILAVALTAMAVKMLCC